MSGFLSQLGSSRLWLHICPGVSVARDTVFLLGTGKFSVLSGPSRKRKGMEAEGMEMALGCQVGKLMQSHGRECRLEGKGRLKQ